MPEKEKQNKYYDILITDFQFHATKPRKPTPWYRAVLKSFRNKKPGRFYTQNFSTKNDGSFEVTLLKLLESDPKFQEYQKIAEKSGKTIRIIIPKHVPFYPSKDAMEKLKAGRKKKRPLTRFWRSDNIN